MEMHRPVKYLEKILTVAAGMTFNVVRFFARSEYPSFIPNWSDKPLLKSGQKTKPPLGFPRTTDSLCPRCVIEARKKILNDEVDYRAVIEKGVGEIKATILERDGQIWMVKECPIHGKFEDILSVDSKFQQRIERSVSGPRYRGSQRRFAA